MPQSLEKRLRLPIRIVDGVWELEFGGPIPVKDGQLAELVVPASAITNPTLVRAMQSKSVIKILDRGARLRVYLATKEMEGVTEEQRKQLVPWEGWNLEVAPTAINSWSAGPLSFFELVLGPATEKQSQDWTMAEGGLWLILEGRKAKGLQSSQFELPSCVSAVNARSLNHAFTILSEVYEQWRISHTGNVYDRFLYQETNGKWYPLSHLRDFKLAKEEERLAHGLWRDFLSEMSSRPTN
jgi:hypothetical protein